MGEFAITERHLCDVLAHARNALTNGPARAL
jgi:hypothetical protein